MLEKKKERVTAAQLVSAANDGGKGDEQARHLEFLKQVFQGDSMSPESAEGRSEG